jgi:hypothetical protein
VSLHSLPDGAELTFSADDRAEASAFDPEHPALVAASSRSAFAERHAITPVLDATREDVVAWASVANVP